jgi:hypothetical protein
MPKHPAPQADNLPTSPTGSETRISFDLADVLTPEEIEKFQAAAKAANAPNLTEHFLDLTLRHERAA